MKTRQMSFCRILAIRCRKRNQIRMHSKWNWRMMFWIIFRIQIHLEESSICSHPKTISTLKTSSIWLEKGPKVIVCSTIFHSMVLRQLSSRNKIAKMIIQVAMDRNCMPKIKPSSNNSWTTPEWATNLPLQSMEERMATINKLNISSIFNS